MYNDDHNPLALDFDTAEVEPQESRPMSPLPPGDYPVRIERAEMKPTSTGGQRLVFTLKVTDGDHANRLVWADMNVVNKSAAAQGIGRRQLATLLAAIDMVGERDMARTIDAELIVGVKVEKSEEYGDKNRVVSFRARGGATAAPAAKPAAPAAKKAPAFMR